MLFSEAIGLGELRLEAEFHTAKDSNIKKGFKGVEITDFVQYGTSDELNELGFGYPVLRLNEFIGHFITKPSKFCKKGMKRRL